MNREYLIGQLVVVQHNVIGRVMGFDSGWDVDGGIWVEPIILGSATHSCYHPENVNPLPPNVSA